VKKKVIIGIVVLVVVAGAILGWALLKDNKNGTVKYRQEALTKGDIEALVITSGTLNPVTTVEVGSQVSGKISRVNVDFNSQVKEGQILAELDPVPFQTRVDQNQANYLSSQASLEKAKVTLDNLQSKYERSLSLFEKNLISYDEKESAEAAYLGAKSDIQAAEARVEQAKSQLESSKVDLSYTIIRSPIDGLVISRNMNVGQTVQASFQAPKLFDIANDLSKMQVECAVDEADVGKVKEGQKVRFTVDAFPEDTFNGTVNQVRFSPTVTQNVVTYTTIVDVDNPGMKLRPGMTATVSIITGEAKGALRVPNAALRFTPTLTPEQMKKIMEEMGQKMTAQRKAEGGQTGSPQAKNAGSPQAKRPAGESSGPRMNFAQGGGMPQGMQGQPGVGGGQRSGRRPSMVWYLGPDGKLNVAYIRTGVTDNSYTEILRSDLKEGQEVIIGTEATQAARSSNPGQMRMFVGR
jgi:HlyD family secretion protein